jgi:hypothetical protein
MGTENLLDVTHLEHLEQVSRLIEEVCLKYPKFRGMVDSCDS